MSLLITPLIKKALYFSAEKHDKQYRKGGNVPYIVHPVLVAWEVSRYTSSEEIISAALLHDVVEDCKSVTVEVLQKEFGKKIADLVKSVSFLESQEKILPWRERKQVYLTQVSKLSSDALIIIAVDKLSNMSSYFGALQSGEDIAHLFGGTLEEYLWYYKEIGDILNLNLDNIQLVKDYFVVFNHYKR